MTMMFPLENITLGRIKAGPADSKLTLSDWFRTLIRRNEFLALFRSSRCYACTYVHKYIRSMSTIDVTAHTYEHLYLCSDCISIPRYTIKRNCCFSKYAFQICLLKILLKIINSIAQWWQAVSQSLYYKQPKI